MPTEALDSKHESDIHTVPSATVRPSLVLMLRNIAPKPAPLSVTLLEGWAAKFNPDQSDSDPVSNDAP